MQRQGRDSQLHDHSGDVDDREPLKVKSFVEFIYGKMVGDKGYIGKDLFCKLFIDGIN